MGVSLFERLCKAHNKSASILKKQYLMNDDIFSLTNTVTYLGAMKHGSEAIAA